MGHALVVVEVAIEDEAHARHHDRRGPVVLHRLAERAFPRMAGVGAVALHAIEELVAGIAAEGRGAGQRRGRAPLSRQEAVVVHQGCLEPRNV